MLGLLLLAMALFVFTKNQVTDRKDSIAQAQQEKAEADQRSQGLKAYGDFSKIKQTRVTSVSELASKRFDWERLMRELALVLPPKVWVTQVDGKTAGAGAAAAAAGGTTPSTPAPAPTTSGCGAAADTASGSTSMTMAGCAPSQKGGGRDHGPPAQPGRRRGGRPQELAGRGRRHRAPAAPTPPAARPGVAATCSSTRR